jgi:release factor glutamine methyltransferase
LTLGQALSQAKATLLSHGISEARLESEALLMHTLGVGRAQLYSRLQEELPPPQLEEFQKLVQRRLRREPLPYILGHREFFGIDFYIDRRAFIPRPESELLVEQALEFASHLSLCIIADVGTGSGAVAVALARHLPQSTIYAIDLSGEALQVAAINCHRHGVAYRVHLLQGDLLQPLPQPVHLIVANLPYVRSEELSQLDPEISDFEPALALDGGKEGTEKIRQLLAQSSGKLRSPGLILLEIGQGEGEAVLSLAKSHFPSARIELLPDLGGIERGVRIEVAPSPGMP